MRLRGADSTVHSVGYNAVADNMGLAVVASQICEIPRNYSKIQTHSSCTVWTYVAFEQSQSVLGPILWNSLSRLLRDTIATTILALDILWRHF